MKLVKIFGMVLALHVVLLTIFFLSPGCQSTPKQPLSGGVQPVSEPISRVLPTNENWSSQAAPDFGPSTYSRSSLEPIMGPTPAERARTSPTRPDDPSAFVGSSASQTASSAVSTYTVSAGDSLWKISRKFGTTIPELQKVNPGMKGSSLRPGDVINVPGGAEIVPDVPAATRTQSVTSAAATGTYVVKSGDSLSKIAARNGTTIAALRAENNLSSDLLLIGQKLVIPGGSSSKPAASASSAPKPEGVTVVIQSGETLGELAARFDVTVQELMRANSISDPRRVRAGQTLVIPGFQAVDSTPAAPIVVPRPNLPEPGRQTAPAPVGTPSTTLPTETIQPPRVDLDRLVPDDAPIVPIDEPVPTP